MNKEIKVVILGETAVGKSSLLLRFCSDQFKETHESTLGAAFLARTIAVKDQQIKFQIWDTAGQEKYKSLTPLYYKGSYLIIILGAQVAILVYDITSRQSFETLKNWVEELNTMGPKKIYKVIVGNKQDLIDEEKVQYDEANSYAKQLGVPLKLTSCKENKGIKEMFQSIGEALLNEQDSVVVPPPKINPEDKSSKLGNAQTQKKKDGSCC
ncbi:hypothetical protein pb186bvf_006052 [Paramecium bursaria]